MSIRAANKADIPRIVEMGSRSLREGPYKDQLGDNPEATAALAHRVIISPNSSILLAEEDGKTVGLIAFAVYDHPFSGEVTASELMWYTEPEYRKSFTAVALLRAAERTARELGAKKMQFTAPTEEVGRAYESLGYKQVEVSYQRSL